MDFHEIFRRGRSCHKKQYGIIWWWCVQPLGCGIHFYIVWILNLVAADICALGVLLILAIHSRRPRRRAIDNANNVQYLPIVIITSRCEDEATNWITFVSLHYTSFCIALKNYCNYHVARNLRFIPRFHFPLNILCQHHAVEALLTDLWIANMDIRREVFMGQQIK